MYLQPVLWLWILKSSNSMLYLPNDKMFPNKFVEVELPNKKQIFARTGQVAVNPAGMYSHDEPCRFRSTPTESAAAFVSAAEAYESPKEEEK